MRYEDDYLDKMGDWFSSATFKAIFPKYEGITFEEWLGKQERGQRYERERSAEGRVETAHSQYGNVIFLRKSQSAQ